jgi:hypothetical protein
MAAVALTKVIFEFHKPSTQTAQVNGNNPGARQSFSVSTALAIGVRTIMYPIYAVIQLLELIGKTNSIQMASSRMERDRGPIQPNATNLSFCLPVTRPHQRLNRALTPKVNHSNHRRDYPALQ